MRPGEFPDHYLVWERYEIIPRREAEDPICAIRFFKGGPPTDKIWEITLSMHRSTAVKIQFQTEAPLVFTCLKGLGIEILSNETPIGTVLTLINERSEAVDNISRALLALKVRNLISESLLNAIFSIPENDHHEIASLCLDIKIHVENREIAYIRKAARVLALGKADPESPIAKLPPELLVKIAAFSDEQEIFDETRASKIASIHFCMPPKAQPEISSASGITLKK